MSERLGPESQFELLQSRDFLLLRQGIQDLVNPLPWPYLIGGLRKMLGSPNPNWIPLTSGKYEISHLVVNELIDQTPLRHLLPEIMYSLGFDSEIKALPPIDALILNARHQSEPISYEMFNVLESSHKLSGVVQPVAHYTDREALVLGPRFVRRVENLFFIASTQQMYGGTYDVLVNTLRLFREPDIASRTGRIHIVMPTEGGGRGHRESYDKRFGVEVFEAKVNPKKLTETTKDILERLEREEGIIIPREMITFYTIDAHHPPSMEEGFASEGYGYVNTIPSSDYARAILDLLNNEGLDGYPIRIVACDKGALDRSWALAKSILELYANGRSVDIVLMNKYRKIAGVIEKSEIVQVVSVKKSSNNGYILNIKDPLGDSREPCVLIYSDDMWDTGGTAREDNNSLFWYYPWAVSRLFVGSHPILSLGLDMLNNTGFDWYFFPNTLKHSSLWERDDVIQPKIAETILINSGVL